MEDLSLDAVTSHYIEDLTVDHLAVVWLLGDQVERVAKLREC
jgi:hypothetical protein